MEKEKDHCKTASNDGDPSSQEKIPPSIDLDSLTLDLIEPRIGLLA